MKKLTITLAILICSLFACKKEVEPKSLILKNGFDQTQLPLSKTDLTISEIVYVSLLDANKKNISFEQYPVSFSTVSNLSKGYQVVSVPVQDNAKYLLVTVMFSSKGYTILEFRADTKELGEGINRITVNENNSIKVYSIFD